MCLHIVEKLCSSGVIGSHSRLKICRRKSCRFDSGLEHQTCLGDGIGIRVGLRSRILGVRLPSEAPNFCSVRLSVRTRPFQGRKTGSIPVPSTKLCRLFPIAGCNPVGIVKWGGCQVVRFHQPAPSFHRRVAASLLLNDWPPQRPGICILEVSHSGRLHGTVNPAPYGASVVQIHLPPPIYVRLVKMLGHHDAGPKNLEVRVRIP